MSKASVAADLIKKYGKVIMKEAEPMAGFGKTIIKDTEPVAGFGHTIIKDSAPEKLGSVLVRNEAPVVPALTDIPKVNKVQPADAMKIVESDDRFAHLAPEQKKTVAKKLLEKMQGVAGAAAVPMGDPYAEAFGKIKQGYNWYKENVQQPIADKIISQTDPAQRLIEKGQVQQAPGLQTAGRILFDPANLAGDIGAAAQFGAEMLPDSGAKSDVPKAETTQDKETLVKKLAKKKYAEMP